MDIKLHLKHGAYILLLLVLLFLVLSWQHLHEAEVGGHNVHRNQSLLLQN